MTSWFPSAELTFAFPPITTTRSHPPTHPGRVPCCSKKVALPVVVRRSVTARLARRIGSRSVSKALLPKSCCCVRHPTSIRTCTQSPPSEARRTVGNVFAARRDQHGPVARFTPSHVDAIVNPYLRHPPIQTSNLRLHRVHQEKRRRDATRPLHNWQKNERSTTAVSAVVWERRQSQCANAVLLARPCSSRPIVSARPSGPATRVNHPAARCPCRSRGSAA